MKEIKRYCFGNKVPNRNDKAGPVVSYDDHAEIVAEKDARISELEFMLQKNAVKDGNEIYTLLQQVRALASENDSLSKFCKNAAFYADYESELGMERGGFTDGLNDIKTSATDAVIREIRAQVLEEMADDCEADWLDTYIDELRQSAARIRSGEQP